MHKKPRKLDLQRETIRNLDARRLAKVQGGHRTRPYGTAVDCADPTTSENPDCIRTF